jgi:hypothetical protein
MLAALIITADINNMNLLSIALSWFCLFFSNYNMLTLKYGWLINRTHQRRTRFVIQFLCLQDAKTRESGGRTTVQYGNNCMNQRKVYKSVKGGQMLLIHILGAH